MDEAHWKVCFLKTEIRAVKSLVASVTLFFIICKGKNMENEERIILTVNAKGDTTFCTEALKDMSNEQLNDLAFNLHRILLGVVNFLQNRGKV